MLRASRWIAGSSPAMTSKGRKAMSEHKPRYGVDAYLDWVEAEGLSVFEDYAVDLFAVETATWPRYGVKAAAVHLKGRGDFANMVVFDLPPGGATAPQRHLYEDVVYVLEGNGSTQIEFADGAKKSFEWGPRSLFAIPLNARHRHFNGSGRARALIVSTTDLPLVMNTFHDERKRSEEHTSELQSRQYLVCRLLLEKKK